MATTRPSDEPAAAKASRPKRVSTPASKAPASGIGIRSITRSNQPVAPTATISSAETMKAPVASAIPEPAARAGDGEHFAAPGVLQAITVGLAQPERRQHFVRPMPQPSAHIHDAVCAGVAPSDCAA